MSDLILPLSRNTSEPSPYHKTDIQNTKKTSLPPPILINAHKHALTHFGAIFVDNWGAEPERDAFVVKVYRDSNAQRAGLKPGDVLISLSNNTQRRQTWKELDASPASSAGRSPLPRSPLPMSIVPKSPLAAHIEHQTPESPCSTSHGASPPDSSPTRSSPPPSISPPHATAPPMMRNSSVSIPPPPPAILTTRPASVSFPFSGAVSEGAAPPIFYDPSASAPTTPTKVQSVHWPSVSPARVPTHERKPPMDGSRGAIWLSRRDTSGPCTLCVLRWSALQEEVAAFTIHAHILGYAVRCCLRRANASATVIQANWRRAQVEFMLGERFLAAEILQAAFRKLRETRARARKASQELNLSQLHGSTSLVSEDGLLPPSPRSKPGLFRSPSYSSARLSRSSSIRSFGSFKRQNSSGSSKFELSESSLSSRTDLTEYSGGSLRESSLRASKEQSRTRDSVISIEGSPGPKHEGVRRSRGRSISSDGSDGMPPNLRDSSRNSPYAHEPQLHRRRSSQRSASSKSSRGDYDTHDLSSVPNGFLSGRRSSSRRTSVDSLGPLLGLGYV